jgi:hypothetical protein
MNTSSTHCSVVALRFEYDQADCADSEPSVDILHSPSISLGYWTSSVILTVAGSWLDDEILALLRDVYFELGPVFAGVLSGVTGC